MLKVLKFVVIALGAGIAARLLVQRTQAKVMDAFLDAEQRELEQKLRGLNRRIAKMNEELEQELSDARASRDDSTTVWS
jgi:prefoldin subunit 5